MKFVSGKEKKKVESDSSGCGVSKNYFFFLMKNIPTFLVSTWWFEDRLIKGEKMAGAQEGQKQILIAVTRSKEPPPSLLLLYSP